MTLGIIVQLVAAGFSALNVPPSTSRPPCGGLDPSFLRDHDTVCIHLVHHARWLGELVLLNSTATQTVVTQLPATIAVGTDAWWAVRDGMVWGRDTDGGANAHAAIEPFSLTVWYRAACRHAESCPDGNAFFDVGLTVSLRSINTASPVRGEHALIVRIGRSSEQMRSLHWKAEWRRCVLEVTATLLEDAASASTSPTPGPSPITRHISAATAKSKECLGIVPWSNEDERSKYVTMSSPNFNMRNEPTACEQLAKANATNAVHIRYFLAQQAEEIRLFEAAERTLCEPQVVSVSPASLHSSPGFVPDKQVSEAVFQENARVGEDAILEVRRVLPLAYAGCFRGHLWWRGGAARRRSSAASAAVVESACDTAERVSRHELPLGVLRGARGKFHSLTHTFPT